MAAPPTGPRTSTVGPWQFVPSALQNSGRYNWSTAFTSSRLSYTDNDVPGWGNTGEYSLPAESLWSGSTPVAKMNPPFLSMTSGQLIESLDWGTEGGPPARLLRGFIRRTYSDANDPNDGCRLNFMFNPPAIQRDFVSYLDQGALDPFNTIYQSGNLVAPPAVLNFTFELFFDRQAEAMDPSNPGTFVDQEFFDKVVRGVTDANVGPNPTGMPDNGLMLGGAQDITVVFSPQMAVSGRPTNAAISYVKFTHRMVPTRMAISITIRAVRIGFVTRETTSVSTDTPEVAVTSARVTGEKDEYSVAFTWADTKWRSTDETLNTLVLGQKTASTLHSGAANSTALEHAKAQVAKFGTTYNADGNGRINLWTSADCSSLVWAAFAETNQSEQLGWPKWGVRGAWAPSTYSMYTGFQTSTAVQKLWGFSGTPSNKADGIRAMQKGDLLIRIRGDGSTQGENHIAFVDSVSGDNVTCFHAKSTSQGVGTSTVNVSNNDYTHGVRPLTRGGSMAGNANNAQDRLDSYGDKLAL